MNGKFVKKAVFAVIISSLLCAETAFPSYAAAFSDTEGHWAENVIERWSEKGLIKGYNGKFSPDDSITRGDTAVILDRLIGYSDKGENVFSDLDGSEYYADSVLKLNKEGIMFGSFGSVRPLDSITREEAFVMINRIYNFKGTSETTGFEDENDVSEWARDAVFAMCENKIINGSGGKINPQMSITRAELIQILDNIAEYLKRIAEKIEEDFDFGNDSGNGGDKNDGGITIGGNTGTSGSGKPSGSNKPSGSGSSGGTSDKKDEEEKDNGTEEETPDPSVTIGASDLEAGGIW